MQAACLDPILRAKVRSWAVASGGRLPAAYESGGYVGAEGWDAGRAKWAQLKSVERAVEKVVRVYDKARTHRPSQRGREGICGKVGQRRWPGKDHRESRLGGG